MFSPPAKRCANITGRYLSSMNEELVTLEGLTDREIMHKLLDKILDTDGAENTAIWVQCFPDFVGGNPRLVEYRLHIDTEKTVQYIP